MISSSKSSLVSGVGAVHTPVLSSFLTSSKLSTSSRLSATLSPTSLSNNGTLASPASKIIKKGVSPGVVAGVAIGCLIAGAAITVFVCFLLYRRKGSKRQAPHSAPNDVGYQNRGFAPEKGAAVVTSPVITSSIDHLLPQPVEDDKIIKEMSKIRDNIKNYVRTYHHFEPVQSEEVDGRQLAEIAEATGISTLALAGLLSNSSTRGDAIRLVISYIALSRCEDTRFPNLLPHGLDTLATAIPRGDENMPASSALFSKWKAVTGTLLQSRQGQVSGVLSQGVSGAIAELNSTLAPFERGSIDNGQRRKNLELICGRAEGIALLLFSQPSSFRFDFKSQKALVVFPALLQVINEQAQILSPPRVFSEKEYAADAGS